jgi:rod shape-determining protein MreC
MRQLLEFLFKYRAFFIFVILQALCVWMIVANNNYQRAVYLNTTSQFTGSIIEKIDNVSDFINLKKVNENLAEENSRLKAQILNQKIVPIDTSAQFSIPSDSLDSVQYLVISAEVIDNSIRNTSNFITINKGRKDGILPGMGVVNENGVVGKVRSISKNRAQIISVLNKNNQISATLKRTNRLGSIQWDGLDPRVAKLLYIPVDVEVQVGDSIVTSSFNSIFPKHEMIGFVKSAKPDQHNRDYEIEISLSVDFGVLNYVYVIENRLKLETDSLEESNPLDFNE